MRILPKLGFITWPRYPDISPLDISPEIPPIFPPDISLGNFPQEISPVDQLVSTYARGLQLAARGPNLAREGRGIGPRISAKMLKKLITFSLKSIFLY